ncbi:MAG: diguanylate cyclase [Candidatus Angelobacter sp.]|nr:diguanylate cyclase [Candidatus Angelobacter sp.]
MAALNFAPSLAQYQQSARLLAVLILAGCTLLAARLHSLRGFLAGLSLASYFAFIQFSSSDPFVSRCATTLLACDFALLLLVEDVFFDWQAVMWWAGFMAVQWTSFTAFSRWDPAMLGSVATKQFILPFASIGPLELIFALSVILLLMRFLLFSEAVGAGLVWALVAISAGLRNLGLAEAYIALSGLVIGICVIERSHWIAYHDELTGLPGRRAFNEALAGLGAVYGIAIVDVDHFKKFNDTFGHETGDQVLRKVAASLSKVGAGGSAYRCGGEEFALVFPELGLEDCKYYAEEVRKSIEEDTFFARGPSRSNRERPERRTAAARGRHSSAVETSVTVSIGLSEPARPNQDVQEVIAAADKALYNAKHLGRNRIEVFSPRQARTAKPNAPKAAVNKAPASKA